MVTSDINFYEEGVKVQAIKPTWAIAKQISRRHTMVSGLITTSIMLVGLGIQTLIYLYLGYDLSYALYADFFKKYGGLVSAVILPIHLIPVNFYAIIRVLPHKFKDFRIVLYAVDPATTVDEINDGDLPTLTK